jgi:hypothetical protein
LGVRARDLDLELAVLARDSAGSRAEGESNLLGEAGNLAEPDAKGRGHLEADEPGCDGAAGDACGHLVRGEEELDAVGLEVQGMRARGASSRERCSHSGLLG